MNSIGADQDIAAHGPGVLTCAIEEIRGDAALILDERPKPAARVDRALPQPLFDGAVDHALQPAAMNRKLRHIMAGVDAAGFAPDLLAMAIEIVKHIGTDRDVVELLQQAEAGKFTDRMRQRIDADAKLADGVRLLEQFATNAAGAKHQRGSEAPDSASDDNRLHRPTPRNTFTQWPLTSHEPSLGRKRRCRLRFQLGPGLRLSLNFQIVEILPVAHAVTENLLLARQILRRAEYGVGAVPGRGLQRERWIDQMWAAERHQIGPARGENGVDLIGGCDVSDAQGRPPRFVSDLVGGRCLEHAALYWLGGPPRPSRRDNYPIDPRLRA